MRFLLHSKSIPSNQILEPETTTGWNPHKKYNTDDLEGKKKKKTVYQKKKKKVNGVLDHILKYVENQVLPPLVLR